MTKLKILVSAPIKHIETKRKILNKNFKCKYINHNHHNKINLLLKISDGWICSPSPKKLISIENYPNIKFIKFIATPSTGTTHISNKLIKNTSIKVLSISMDKKIKTIKASSEYTFSLALTLIKKINLARKYVNLGYWREKETYLRSNELFNKTAGIIGYGRIGKNLNTYAKAFGMKTIIYDPKVKNNNSNKINNIKLIQDNCHIIFICINFTFNNLNFINKKFFSKLKKRPFIINTSRGEVVNEADLLYALKSKIISGAGLDVLKNEQNLDINNNKLVKYSKKNHNLLITPHIAGLTFESEYKAMSITIELINKFYK
tara:strand:+ start:172 stop:1125 length:954 start_codon:yes stop_codon:yes gene_type:complete